MVQQTLPTTPKTDIPPRPTVKDDRVRARFVQQVGLNELKQGVHVGRWKWAPEATRPSWDCLKTAPVWTEPRFESLRHVLKAPAKAQMKVVGDDKVPSAVLTAEKRTASVFDARPEELPQNIASAKPRALVAVVSSAVKPLSAAILHHVDTAPLLLFGEKVIVKAAVEQLRRDHEDKVYSKVNVYTRPQHLLPNARRKLRHKVIMLVADSSALLPQVSPPALLVAPHMDPGNISQSCPGILAVSKAWVLHIWPRTRPNSNLAAYAARFVLSCAIGADYIPVCN